MKVVISLGGSMVYKNGINEKFVKKFIGFINALDFPVALAVGGGKIAKEYVVKGKNLGANNFELDQIAIEVMRANSRLVASVLTDSMYFDDFEEAKNSFIKGKNLIVLGVGTPGQTSDSTSALFAEQVEADRWVNITNVDGIYDKDPSKFKNAKKFKSMTHKQLVDLVERSDQRKPRENFVIDTLAAKILARSKIEAHIVKGDNFADIEKAVFGLEHKGTVIKK